MIYVVGRYEEEEEHFISTGEALFKAFFKVLDTKTQTWHTLPANYSEDKGVFSAGNSEFVDGKLHVVPWTSRCMAYNPKEARWEQADRVMGAFMSQNAYCEIDNVLCSAFLGFLRWYDTQSATWRNFMGLPQGFFSYSCHQIRLANFRGKIAAFWAQNFPCDDDDDDDDDDCDDKKMIWCAVIALDKRTSCEIWGIVESLDHVLTVPKDSNLVKALAATL
ncbi:PREDICTED: F-box/kelch-repeat protein At3g06570 [Camelina sativa]|uniref:F-box/kelch-repeat protein At3g06570 n=1 Tax=Camelina sativa TaxID=90675 RepID=A0ABM1Q6K7_CAMSA|nr:PREDICTED: F-box/kelch-repeat protein At3g06570 [Camelina sativa]